MAGYLLGPAIPKLYAFHYPSPKYIALPRMPAGSAKNEIAKTEKHEATIKKEKKSLV